MDIKKVIRFGTITVSLAIIANYLPVLYIWVKYGAIPEMSDLGALFASIFAAYSVSWIVQPLSYFGAFGTLGTYVTWVVGTAADVRLPSTNMAQKVSNTEGNTPEGDAITAIAIATSVFVTVTLVSIFSVVGASIIPMLPKVITGAFRYMLPALFAAVYVNMAVKDMKQALPILVSSILIVWLSPSLGVPGAVVTLACVVVAIVYSLILGNQNVSNEDAKK